MVKLEDLNKSGGGGSFFTLKNGETKKVRFLFTEVSDIQYVSFRTHVYNSKKNSVTILCSREDGDPKDMCKWCASGNNSVVRCIIPLYSETDKEIQYWTGRSGKWVSTTLIPQLSNLPSGMPISGQIFNVSRHGDGLDTVFTIVPDLQTPNDKKAKNEFGEVVADVLDLNTIKPNDYDFNPNAEDSTTPSAAQSTRRTTDIF